MPRNLIFVVAYNHEDYLQKVVARIPDPLLADPRNELLIIDDGSRDHTFQVGDLLSRTWQHSARLTVLRNPVNQGYGGNQKIGYRYAIDQGFDRVFLVHGDGQYAPECLPALLEEYARDPAPDAVFGTRVATWRSALGGGMPLYKLLGNRLLTALENGILGSRLSEFHSGYRSYSTALLRRIPFELNANGFHFDTEIIIQILAAGGRIVELPVPTHYGEEVCHVNGLRYAWDVLASCLHYRIQAFGFLYDRKFDLPRDGEDPYPLKPGPYSSHARVAAHVAPGSRVLDIGCGAGHVARLLAERSCVVDGVDVLPREAVHAPLRSYHRLDLARDASGLGELLRTGEYDYLVLADVIEHVPMPEALLDLLREVGSAERPPVVVASTGNVGFFIVRAMLALGQFNYGKRGILDRTHTRLFTKGSFRRIFRQCGFEVLGVEGIGVPVGAVARRTRLVRSLEWLVALLARGWTSLFAYQLLIEARALPTVRKLLERTESHSRELRDRPGNGSERDRAAW